MHHAVKQRRPPEIEIGMEDDISALIFMCESGLGDCLCFDLQVLYYLEPSEHFNCISSQDCIIEKKHIRNS